MALIERPPSLRPKAEPADLRFDGSGTLSTNLTRCRTIAANAGRRLRERATIYQTGRGRNKTYCFRLSGDTRAIGDDWKAVGEINA